MENNACEIVPVNRLKYFPITMFAIVMGLSGLAIAYQKFGKVFGVDSTIGIVLTYIDTALFLMIVTLYGSKALKYFGEVKKEFAHPVRINFFAAMSISMLLLSIAYESINHVLSQNLFIIGTLLQTFFTFYTISFWINKNLEMNHSNPAWFIPIVGNILVPVAGFEYANVNFLMYYFSVGLFFWIILTAVIINRIIFHNQLVAKFMPTLFIFIAPPAIGFVAYVKMFGEVDMFALFLYNMGLFFSFLLFFMYKNFINLKFFISWWAFTFPLAAITIASILMYTKTHITMYQYFSFFFITVTTFVIFYVAYMTIKHMLKKEICIEE